MVANGVDAPGPRRAGRDLLMRLPPRLSTPHDGELRLAGEAAPATAVRLILDLNAGCLPIQGPPGAGKTFTMM